MSINIMRETEVAVVVDDGVTWISINLDSSANQEERKRDVKESDPTQMAGNDGHKRMRY